MAATIASEVTDGPVLSVINKRLRTLRKKYNRILQMEQSISQGKTINKEQEEVLRSKPAILVLIEELERLRLPLTAAISEEVGLAVQRYQQQLSVPDGTDNEKSNSDGDEGKKRDHVMKDLLNLLYFGLLFDVKSQTDFTATMLTRTHERGCCLTYDYVTDDVSDLLGEGDLDTISMLGSLLISRPVDSSKSHKNALQQCFHHACLWLDNSDKLIGPNVNVSYADLREKLNKIMVSDYFTTMPEMKAPVEVVAAAASSFASFQVHMHRLPIAAQSQESSTVFQQLQGHNGEESQSTLANEPHMVDGLLDTRSSAAVIVDQEKHADPVMEETKRQHQDSDIDHKEQHYVFRIYNQNQRGSVLGGTGGRRGYSTGRGGRNGSRSGAGYQNVRNQYYESSGNYYPRNNYYYYNRGRGSRGGGYNSYSSGPTINGNFRSDVGVAS